jgi:uncharacterized protein (TIGR02466 family)
VTIKNNIKNSTIELLFPTPIMFNKMNREFTAEELSIVKNHSKKTYQNVGNTTSINNYILNIPELINLKNIVQDNIEHYISQVYKPRYPVIPYITQSWLNWTEPGEYHHTHAHPNSFISGVLYIHADIKEDQIKFHKDDYQQINLETDNYDTLNAKTWWFNVKTGDVVMFPSSLTHNVEKVTSGKTRISLAFNSFLHGTIGDNKNLTELKMGNNHGH